MQIRRLEVEDVSIAIQVIETLKTQGSTDLSSRTMSRFLDSDAHYLIAAFDDNKVPIGFALSYELVRVDQVRPMMLLYEIEVSEQYQRQGIGTAMLNLLKEFCYQRNVYKMWVPTSQANIAAKHLYEATGATIREDGDCFIFTYDLNGVGN